MSSANLYSIVAPQRTDVVLGIDNPTGSWAVNRFLVSAILDLLEESDIPDEIARLTDLTTFITATSTAVFSNKSTSDNFTIGGSLIVGGTALSTPISQLNLLTGLTANAAELNVLDGAVVTAADLTKLGQVTATAAQLNKLNGALVTTAEINILAGATVTTAELNKLDGLTASTTELNLLTGATTLGQSLLVATGITAPVANINSMCGSFNDNYNGYKSGEQYVLDADGQALPGLSQGGPSVGDIIDVYYYIKGTKGGTAGLVKLAITITNGVFGQDLTVVTSSTYVPAGAEGSIMLSFPLKVTAAATLLLSVIGYSDGSDFTITTGSQQCVYNNKLKQ